MNRADRRAWRSVQTWADLGAVTVAWLHGTVEQTPGHLGPPAPETIPLIPVLTAANLAGFVTDNSQRAGSTGRAAWEAWVSGFASTATRNALRYAAGHAGLEIGACRRGQHCDHKHFGARRCPWRECAGNWAARCPHVASEIRDAWYVIIRDPQPGRNDVLWPALERFACGSAR